MQCSEQNSHLFYLQLILVKQFLTKNTVNIQYAYA